MTTALCSTECGEVSALPVNYFNCIDRFRKYAHKFFVLMKCDYQFTDILDAEEWATAIAAGNIILSPPGTLTLPTPDQTLIDIDPDTQAIADITYTIDYVTYQVSQGDVADSDFFKTLFTNHSGYVLLWFDNVLGDERWSVQDDWKTAIEGGAPATVSGTSPGFKFSVTQIPHWQEGEGTKGQWVTQFQIEADGMIGHALIPGAAEALYATTVGS